MDQSTASAILSLVREKQAGDPLVESSQLTALQRLSRQQTDWANSEALRKVLGVSLASLGVGAAGRGALGLYNLWRRNVSEPEETRAPEETSLPYPTRGVPKLAAWSLKDFFGGDFASQPSQVPWMGSAMLLGGLGSMAAGWKGMDAVLDARRRKELDAEQADAEQEFRDAMLSQYPQKQAGDHGLGRDLDRAFDGLEKAAEGWLDQAATEASPMAGQAANLYSMYAVPAALVAGYAAFKASRGRRQRALIEQAVKNRRKRMADSRPSDLHVSLEPVGP